MLKLFNSISGEKEEFKPINYPHVGMYVCGMTVYDFCHIGHARVMIVFDILARHLRSQAYDLRYVRNITDIDDKIIKRAHENEEDFQTLTARFIQEMHADEKSLGCLAPDFEPKATENIAQIIDLIQKLLAKNFAYKASNGDVYFRVRNFSEYGKLAHRNIDELKIGARVELNENKEDPLDFVLWKASKPEEPAWESPFGLGRPGWHIECSAMSTSILGETFDIHGGGMDLKFPHHECEIAQSQSVSGKKFVNYWIHNGFVNIDNEKMSKSLGNFFTTREVLKKYDGETLRFFIMQTHYRAPLNYSDFGLNEAQKALHRLYAALASVDLKNNHDIQALSKYEQLFIDAMNDDLNTPKALAVLFDLAKEINRKVSKNEPALAEAFCLKKMAAQLGILQGNPEEKLKGKSQNHAISEEEIEKLIIARTQAKKNKNYAEADRIRDFLYEKSVEIKDTPNGVEWKWK